jgi:hypothetical protein
MMKAVLVHGFNVRDGGANTVDRLAPHLEDEGYEVDMDEADYGFIGLTAVRLRKHKAIIRIIDALQDADVVVAHSNGANYVLKALKHLPKTYHIHVVFLSPAANRKAKFAESVKKAHVFYTKTDFWIWVSGLLPFHPWGRMGQKGAKTEDPRVINYDYTDVVKDHSDWFDDDHTEMVVRAIHRAVERP